MRIPSTPAVDSFTEFRGSEQERFVALPALTAQAGSISCTLPAYAVVTMVGGTP